MFCDKSAIKVPIPISLDDNSALHAIRRGNVPLIVRRGSD